MLAFLTLMMAAVGMSAMAGTSSDAEEIDSEEPTDDESTFNVSAAQTVNGTDGNDLFLIDTGDINGLDIDYADPFVGDFGYYYDGADDTAAPEVTGGDGDDTFDVVQGHAIIRTGDGADIVDAANMKGGLIFANEGDHVTGSDISDNQSLGILMTGAGTVEGGSGDEVIQAVGDGAVLNGGAGDDWLISTDGGAVLNGGAGDDFIDATALTNEYSDHWDETGAADSATDIVDAGAGDDRVEDVANGDIVTLGEGSDLAVAIYDHALSDLDPVTFTDYDPTEDTVFLRILDLPTPVGTPASHTTSAGDDVVTLDGRWEILESDGDAHVFVDDALVAVFENTSGLVPEPYVREDRYGDFMNLGLKFAPA